MNAKGSDSLPEKADPDKKVSRADIEAKLRELRGDVDERVDDAKLPAIAIATTVAVVFVLAAYVMGRRRGKKKSMVLEIRRI
jgi:hypothetical protein